jgi:hypothetical protein
LALQSIATAPAADARLTPSDGAGVAAGRGRRFGEGAKRTERAHEDRHPRHRPGRESTVFVSGNDDTAKRTVIDLLTAFGHEDVIDLGGIATARGPEMYLPLWLRLMGPLGTAEFNLLVVR